MSESDFEIIDAADFIGHGSDTDSVVSDDSGFASPELVAQVAQGISQSDSVAGEVCAPVPSPYGIEDWEHVTSGSDRDGLLDTSVEGVVAGLDLLCAALLAVLSWLACCWGALLGQAQHSVREAHLKAHACAIVAHATAACCHASFCLRCVHSKALAWAATILRVGPQLEAFASWISRSWIWIMAWFTHFSVEHAWSAVCSAAAAADARVCQLLCGKIIPWIKQQYRWVRHTVAQHSTAGWAHAKAAVRTAAAEARSLSAHISSFIQDTLELAAIFPTWFTIWLHLRCIGPAPDSKSRSAATHSSSQAAEEHDDSLAANVRGISMCSGGLRHRHRRALGHRGGPAFSKGSTVAAGAAQRSAVQAARTATRTGDVPTVAPFSPWDHADAAIVPSSCPASAGDTEEDILRMGKKDDGPTLMPFTSCDTPACGSPELGASPLAVPNAASDIQKDLHKSLSGASSPESPVAERPNTAGAMPSAQRPPAEPSSYDAFHSMPSAQRPPAEPSSYDAFHSLPGHQQEVIALFTLPSSPPAAPVAGNAPGPGAGSADAAAAQGVAAATADYAHGQGMAMQAAGGVLSGAAAADPVQHAAASDQAPGSAQGVAMQPAGDALSGASPPAAAAEADPAKQTPAAAAALMTAAAGPPPLSPQQVAAAAIAARAAAAADEETRRSGEAAAEAMAGFRRNMRAVFCAALALVLLVVAVVVIIIAVEAKG